MSGKRFLLDTNAIVALLRGEGSLVSTLNSASWVGIPIISVLEFLSFPALSAADRACFEEFVTRVEVVDLTASDAALLDRILEIRATLKLKLPDAIVAASALVHRATLVSADQGFGRLADPDILSSW